MTAFAWPTSAACLRTSSIEVGAGVVKPIWVPPLKSMPRLSPRTPSARTETTITAAEIPNHSRRRLMKSILSHGRMPPPEVPITRGLSRSFEPASSDRKARVARTAVSIEIAVPIRSMRANPRTEEVATANSTRAVIAVTTLASTIVAKPFV